MKPRKPQSDILDHCTAISYGPFQALGLYAQDDIDNEVGVAWSVWVQSHGANIGPFAGPICRDKAVMIAKGLNTIWRSRGSKMDELFDEPLWKKQAEKL